jgi:hypothetical protein
MFETLNLFGWKVVTGKKLLPDPIIQLYNNCDTVLSIVVLVFTVISFTSSWWIIDYLHHCKDDVHLVVYLRYGLCGVDKTGGISRNDCIRWNEHHEWEEIDNDSNANTLHAAAVVFPVLNALFLFSVSASALQMAVCFAYMKFRAFARLEQYLAVIFNVVYVLTSFTVGMMGGKTDVTLKSTWSSFTPCKDGYSYPFTAYYSLAIACIAASISMIFLVFPGNIYVLHLVDYEIDSEDCDNQSKDVSRDSLPPHAACNPIAFATEPTTKTVQYATDRKANSSSVPKKSSWISTPKNAGNHTAASPHSGSSSFSLGQDE